MNEIDVKIKLENSDIKVPEYKNFGDAGFDIAAFIDNETGVVSIPPESQLLIKTGLYLEIPLGFELQIRPRSGLALKNEISITNSPATIDSSYRGELGIILRNNSKLKEFQVRNGDRIAQGVIAPVWKANFKVVDKLEESERGTGGFGSTGV